MPKKFSIQHPRATALKERENATKLEETVKKQREEEQAYWLDDDKTLKKKQQRKEDLEKKRELQLAKKAETKLLLEKEMSALKSGKVQGPKLTRVQINAKVNIPKVTELEEPLVRNLNRIGFEGEEARGVSEAIEVLRMKSAEVDKHPERRRKAAFSAFERRRLEEIKKENPALKLSQMKQLVFKEWQKSSENPINAVKNSKQ